MINVRGEKLHGLRRRCAIGAALLLLSSCTAAQLSNAPPSDPPATAEPKSAETLSVDQTATKPSDVRTSTAQACTPPLKPPVSIVALANLLRNPELRRRRGETTDEFDIRTEKLLGEPRRMVGEGAFPFVVPVPREQIEFDPKTSTLTIKPTRYSAGLLPTVIGNGNQVIIVRSTRTSGTVTTLTAFEGKRLVPKDEETVVAVNVHGGDHLGWPRNFKSMSFQIAPVGDRRNKRKVQPPDVAVVFAGRLQSPYISEGISRQESRPDFLHDVTTYTTTVVIDSECAALLNRTDNQVLTTFDLH
jgi:hypothetical protein